MKEKAYSYNAPKDEATKFNDLQKNEVVSGDFTTNRSQPSDNKPIASPSTSPLASQNEKSKPWWDGLILSNLNTQCSSPSNSLSPTPATSILDEIHSPPPPLLIVNPSVPEEPPDKYNSPQKEERRKKYYENECYHYFDDDYNNPNNTTESYKLPPDSPSPNTSVKENNILKNNVLQQQQQQQQQPPPFHSQSFSFSFSSNDSSTHQLQYQQYNQSFSMNDSVNREASFQQQPLQRDEIPPLPPPLLPPIISPLSPPNQSYYGYNASARANATASTRLRGKTRKVMNEAREVRIRKAEVTHANNNREIQRNVRNEVGLKVKPSRFKSGNDYSNKTNHKVDKETTEHINKIIDKLGNNIPFKETNRYDNFLTEEIKCEYCYKDVKKIDVCYYFKKRICKRCVGDKIEKNEITKIAQLEGYFDSLTPTGETEYQCDRVKHTAPLYHFIGFVKKDNKYIVKINCAHCRLIKHYENEIKKKGKTKTNNTQ